MTIKNFIEGGGQRNFVPIENIPTLSLNATIGEAFSQMRKHGLKVSLLEEPGKLSLIRSDDIMNSCEKEDRCSVSESIGEIVCPLDHIEVIDQTQPAHILTRSIQDNRYVAILREGSIIGLAFPHSVEMYQPSGSIYRCKKGQHFFSIPAPNRCPWDGSEVEEYL